MFCLFLIISKSAKTAMLLTAIVPGGGQFYTQRYIKGIIIGGTQSYLIYKEVQTQMDLNKINQTANPSPELQQEKEDLLDQRRQTAWWMALVWTIGILDAYVDAQLYGFESDVTIDKRGSPKVELSFKIKY
jgi:hypothetical protein